jgi:hypothetical protein
MMLQTSTPPPPNLDAAAATTTIANLSANTTTPGGTPVAATGRNVGGMNPNITFAPLGAGGRQQNSGNSANLQPTTQSNLGTNAGLVGKFGAIYLGSTSTTIGTSGSNHVPRKKSNALMLSPYSWRIDPSSSTGVTKYINFIKSPCNKWINCMVGNCNFIFVGLAEKAKQYSLAILRIPTSSTGKMAGAPLTINTISLANVNLGSYVNILSKHTIKLTNDQLHVNSSWFFGTENDQLVKRKTHSNMVAHLVNLEATGNQGLVANSKVEHNCKSVMLYHFLVNLLKTTKMTCYQMDQEKYTYIQEGDPTIKHFCSLNLWAMMREEIWPQTKVSINNLETKLSNSTFAMCDTSVSALITKMLDIKHQIEAEKGVNK